jgi:hypothetical protein
MSAFTHRIEQARRFQARLQELFRKSLGLVAEDDGPPVELVVLESEISDYHREQEIEMPAAPPTPEAFGGILNLGALGRLTFWMQAVTELGSVRVGFSREVTIRELAAESSAPSVDLMTHGWIPLAELMNLLRTKAFQPDFAAAPITPGPFADADGLLKALALAIVGRLADPLALGINARYWNRARIFNPDRILDLTFSALEWNELFPENPVRVIFGGVEEALQHPELRTGARGVTFPEHPTLRPPWRLMHRFSDGTWHEESLGSSAAGAWEAFLDGMIELANRYATAQRDEIDKGLMMRHVEEYRPGDTFHVATGLPTSWLGDYRIMEDAPDLAVVGRNGLAERPSREGVKAREIWFRRFESVIAGALPDPVRTLRFDLRKGKPKTPHRTFIARLKSTDGLDLPVCGECGRPCNRVAHLSFRHHSLPFRFPGSSLVLFTCDESCGAHSCDDRHWHKRWVLRSEIPQVIPPLLAAAGDVVAGPPVWVTEYDSELVDKQAFNRESPQWAAYEDDWEKAYFTFATPATKVGGAPSWVQDACHWRDRAGNPMIFIAQIDDELIEIGDSGRAYVFYSPATEEIGVVTQCF